MRIFLNRKGFALAETLIVAVTVVSIFGLLYSLIYPMSSSYKKVSNYEDLDSKYIAFYLKEMIETDINDNHEISERNEVNHYQTNIYQCYEDNGNCAICGASAGYSYDSSTDTCYVDGVEYSSGEIIYNFRQTVNEGTNGASMRYYYQYDFCDLLDNTSSSKNNRFFCREYLKAARITNIFIAPYNTGSPNGLKNEVIGNSTYRRALQEYVRYMPRHSSYTGNDLLLVVEIAHDSYNTYSDTYYTYASIKLNLNR